MTPKQIFRLKQPCKNRSLSFESGNGFVIINGIKFTDSRSAEDYLMKIPRVDLNVKEFYKENF